MVCSIECCLCAFSVCSGEGVKLWGVDMSRSRSFDLGGHASVVRSVCRSKVGHVIRSCDQLDHMICIARDQLCDQQVLK